MYGGTLERRESPDRTSETVLAVTGEIDLLSAPSFRAHLDTALAESPTVVVDMSRVTFFSSAGVDVLDAVSTTPSRVVVEHPAPPVTRVLDILGWPTRSATEAGTSRT